MKSTRSGWKILSNLAAQAREEAKKNTSAAWLRDCLRRNAQTAYGQRYGFATIRDADEYRDAVPLVAYEDIAEQIDEMYGGRNDVLFRGAPVAWEATGGSGGGHKRIPYSAESLADFRAALLPWLGSLADDRDVARGRAYLAISPAMRESETSPAGVPIGLSDAAYLGDDAARAFASLACVPHDVASARTYDDWFMQTAYHLLCASDLSFVSVWSPTFFFGILDGIAVHAPRLSRILQHGEKIGDATRAPNRDAAKRLEASGGTDARILWPTLKILSCWTDASSAPYATALAKRLPHATTQSKGLLLTEGVVTAPDASGRLLPVPNGFVEFLDVHGVSRLSHELVPEETYEVVMTTAGGLYRYRVGDAVRCTHVTDAGPILHFAGRCGTFSDLVGEKLSDTFVMDCMNRADCRGMLVPDTSQNPTTPGYILLTEETVEPKKISRLDEELRRNPQYAYAIKMRQLRPLETRRVKNLARHYIETTANGGRRIGDIKIPALCVEVQGGGLRPHPAKDCAPCGVWGRAPRP